MLNAGRNPTDPSYNYQEIQLILLKTKGNSVKLNFINPLPDPGKRPEELTPHYEITQEIEEIVNIKGDNGQTKQEIRKKEVVVRKFIQIKVNGKDRYQEVDVLQASSNNHSVNSTTTNKPSALTEEQQAKLDQEIKKEAIKQREKYRFLPVHLTQNKKEEKLKKQREEIELFYKDKEAKEKQEKEEKENNEKKNKDKGKNNSASKKPTNNIPKKPTPTKNLNTEKEEEEKTAETPIPNIFLPSNNQDNEKTDKNNQTLILAISEEDTPGASSSNYDREKNKSIFDKIWESIADFFFSFRSIFEARKSSAKQSSSSTNEVSGYQSNSSTSHSFLYRSTAPNKEQSKNGKVKENSNNSKNGNSGNNSEVPAYAMTPSLGSFAFKHYGIYPKDSQDFKKNNNKRYPKKMDLQRTIKFSPFTF